MDLKVYLVNIDDEEEGVNKISFVHSPAFESNFVHYNNIESKYQIVDEEKRIVFGPIILADHNVLRNDPPLGLHYTRYTSDTIQKIASRYFKNKHIDSVNVHHKIDVNGVYMIESFFKDSNRVVPVMYQDANDGSWFGSFQVENDNVWQDVKNGTFRGYSIEILHSYVDSGETITNNDINSNYSEMNTIQKLTRRKNFRSAYSKAFGKPAGLRKYDSVMTDKGELSVDGDFRLEKEVMLFTSSDEPMVAPDGVYTITEGDLSGETITVSGGVISELNTEANYEGSGSGQSPEGEAKVEAAAAAIEAISELLVEHIDNLVESATGTDPVMMQSIESVKTEVAEIKTQVSGIYSMLENMKANKKNPENAKNNYQATEPKTPEAEFFKHKYSK